MKLKNIPNLKDRKRVNKKGFVQGFGFVLAILFAIAIVIILNKVIFNDFADKLGSVQQYQDSSTAQNIVNTYQTNTYTAMDNLFLGSFIAGFIFLGAISFLEPIRTSRVFFPIAIFVVIPIMILISTVISNTYQTFGDNAIWASGEVTSPIQVHILTNFPLYVFGMSMLLMLVLFAINRSEGL